MGHWVNNIFKRLKLGAREGTPPTGAKQAETVFDQYDASLPTNQNAIDVLPGWSTALPPDCHVKAGALNTFHDVRMLWAHECFGSLRGKRVLELGPLEAGHTIYLEQQGADVLAIESNKLAFLRCLIVKELAGLKQARFMLGDFVKWLETTDETYDLIIASGVLYHMHDPLGLLELASNHSTSLFLWTHFFSDEAMPPGDPRRDAGILSDRPDIVEFHGMPMRLYGRTYANSDANDDFNGGMLDAHSWLHREDILTALRLLGYVDIKITHETPDHQNGPSFSVFASKAVAPI